MTAHRACSQPALAAVIALALAGCSSASGLTTGSIFGASEQKTAASADSAPSPTARALHVGTTSARALKCGYNFDPAALKSNYFAAEAAAGLPVADVAKLESIYQTGANAVTRAAAEEPNYCSAERTAVIKADLNKVLAGNYDPAPVKVANDGGLFGFLEGDTVETGPKFGTNDWWDKQKERVR
ncbi:MAG: hypothetical protein NW205_04545 [Hyphomicrobiaceae bacterium]|nr:hypothetical protein [Hyphomicrobiaceae bacterium]